MKIYKIIDIETGKFASGGIWIVWSKSPGGKIWKRLSDVKKHLAITKGVGNRSDQYPESAEIVEYEATETRRLKFDDL